MANEPYCAHCNARHVAGVDCVITHGVRVNTWALKDAIEAVHAMRARWWQTHKMEPPLEQIVRTAIATYIAE